MLLLGLGLIADLLQSGKVGRRYSPLGGFNPPPNRGRRAKALPLLASCIRTKSPFVPPPKSSPTGAGGTSAATSGTAELAAISVFGASRAEKVAFREAFPNGSNFDALSASILERLGSLLGGQDGSKIDQKSIKMGFPSPSVSASLFISIFGSYFNPPEFKNIGFSRGKTRFFLKIRFHSYYRFRLRFWCQFGSNLVFKIVVFPKFWLSKRASKIRRFSDRFFLDFGSLLGPKMGPSWEPRRLQIRKNTSQKLCRSDFYMNFF